VKERDINQDSTTVQDPTSGSVIAATSTTEGRSSTSVAQSLSWLPGGKVASLAGRYGVVIVLLLLFAAFSIRLPSTFPTVNNIQTMAQNEAVEIMLAFAVLVPLVVGEFDVSVASILGFGGVETVVLDKLPFGMDLTLVVLTGIAIGLINGIIVVGFRVNSFIATIGTSTAIGGLSLALSNGQVLYQNMPASLFAFGRNVIFGVAWPVFYAIVLAILLWYVLQHTPLGRFLYGIGGNAEVARLSGIQVSPLRILAFVIAGAVASFAGVVEAAEVGSADPTLGPSLLLPAFAAVFLGATTIRPGTPTVLGTAVAVTLLNIIVSGLGQIGAPFYVEPIFDGLVLVLAVALSAFVIRAAERGAIRSG
jgi:ribose transport system permease protein